MSIMRQELTSWLKAECQEVGLDLIDAVVSVSGVVDDAFDLSIPGKTMSASDMLEIDLKHTIDAITSVPVKYLTTEERQVIFNLTNEIRDSISKLRYPTDSIKEPADIIQKKALRLQFFIQKYLMEKVVECQIGKPGEERIRRQADWIYVKVGDTEMRGRPTPGGIEFEQVSPSYDQSDLDKAVEIITQEIKRIGETQSVGIIGSTFDVAKGRIDWLYKNQFASFLLYKDSIDEAISDKEAGRIPKTETLKPFTIDELRSLKEYADKFYYKEK